MSSNEELKHLQIPLQEISLATNGFAQENLIARGGFGRVYKGTSNKHGIVAIKRLDRGLGQGDHEFKTEIAFLSVYKHENIVSLLGFCDEEGEKILVYKYESNGSLDKLLKSRDLTWIQRLQICLDAARGLKYLHDDVGPTHRILHRDIKSANILLDENFKAKVSDFGLSRGGPANVQSTFVISNACGTIGYIDPDYFIGGQLTQKSDVFSFGVVLFEVLCGRLANVMMVEDNGQIFNIMVQKHYKEQTLDKIIQHGLQEQINPASLLTFSAIAYRCLKNGVERPTMNKVVEQLQKALDNQLAPSGPWSHVYDDASRDEYDSDFDDLQRRSRRTTSYSQSTLATSQSWNYDVFLSFSGENPRMSFVDHLYFALVQQGIHTYNDNETLPGAESISQSLVEAIEGSKIAVVVFSNGPQWGSRNVWNALSTWRLDVLVNIMKCYKRSELLVIPIFYDVKPVDVRKQVSEYVDAISRIFTGYKNELVKSWGEALIEATDIAGFEVKHRGVIKEIVYFISHKIYSLLPRLEASPQTSVDTRLFGIGNRVRDFKSRLQVLSGDAQMVAVCGMQGSGKSTLASSVFDDIRLDFEGCCFIKDVRAESRMYGLKMLQERILSTLLRSKVLMLGSIKEGIDMMKTRLRRNSVLIVLDDVDHIDHLNMLAGSRDWFGDGSLIIITTRNKHLAEAHNVDVTHNVKMLDVNEAVNLFSWHAFGKSTPAQGFEEVSVNLVSKFGGHPSALISLASFLRDKGMMKWMETLARLEGIPVDEILEKFKICDDGVTRNVPSWLLVEGGSR